MEPREKIRVRRTSLVVAALALTLVGLGGFASSASATFHLIKVRELFPGTATAPQSDYVELQAYSPFQNQLQFGQLKVYSANGTNVSTFMPSTPPAPVPNNANQGTAVVADTGFAAEFPGVTPDFIDSSLDLNPAAGAVCWPITEPPFEDCVSWGAFTGNANLPDSAGSPFQGSGTSGAIGDGESIVRSISANCPTALDDADDTNNSAADFSESAPNPRPNSAPITEAVCSTGPGVAPNPVKKAKKKCKKRRRRPGAGSGKPTTGGGSPAYAAKKKKCKKKRK